jgi:hypothetical protein
LLSKITQRKQAYEFIYQKAEELETKGSYGIDEYVEKTDIVYLEDLDKLKRGIADPSNELVSILKKILRPVASDIEIEGHLVKPFDTKYNQ